MIEERVFGVVVLINIVQWWNGVKMGKKRQNAKCKKVQQENIQDIIKKENNIVENGETSEKKILKETIETEEKIDEIIKKEKIKEDKEKRDVEENKLVEVKQKEEMADSDSVKDEATSGKNIKEKWNEFLSHVKGASPESIKTVSLAGLTVVLPICAIIIVVATITSIVRARNEKQGEQVVAMTETSSEETSVVEPLEVDVYPEVNAVITSYYTALAEGDMDTVQNVMDSITQTELIKLKNNNEYVESYNDIVCYTRNGIVNNSHFVYVTYQAKFDGFDTTVPGVTTHYVYLSEDGSYRIAKELSDEVNAALKVTSCQDDVVDIFNKIDVEYKEILAANEELNNFLTEMSAKAKTMAGEEIAKLEVEETSQTENEVLTENEQETPQTKIVDEEVKATATVNVRSSDSENADKIGRVETGTVLKRTEDRVNGWSKVIFENKEAFIKSDYLEVISSNPVEETSVTQDENVEETNDEAKEEKKEETKAESTTSSTAKNAGTIVTAKTNVKVRSAASTSSDAIGMANGGTEYKLIEDQGEWLKIEYKGKTGFVKAEYFE